MKRVVSLILTLGILLSLIPAAAFAVEDTAPAESQISGDNTGADTQLPESTPPVSEQGFAEPVVPVVRSVTLTQSAAGRTLSASATEYVTDVDTAATVLREAMERRESSLIINYALPQTDPSQLESAVSDLLSSIYEASIRHTGSPTEGDYLLWHLGAGDFTCSATYTSEGRVTITYSLAYYTTAEQEMALTTAVTELIADLGVQGMASDYEKVCAIYDYITSHVNYDHDGLNDPNDKLKYTAYGALIEESAVCQGFASLFYRLALTCGVDSRVITGTSLGEDHAWNIVKLDGKYYYVDATWDEDRNAYSYFLKGSDTFEDHAPEDRFFADDFIAQYPISSTDFAAKNTWMAHAADKFASGTGTKDDPYVITTPEELARIHQFSQDGAYFLLAADIDLRAYEWTPIDTFTGVIDGGGHKIIGMRITGRIGNPYVLILGAEGTGNPAFIDYAVQATLCNVSFEDGSVDCISDGGCAAIVVAKAEHVTIENVSISGTVRYSASGYFGLGSGYVAVAGCLGYGANSVSMDNVFVNADISVNTDPGGAEVGGILGLAGSIQGYSAPITLKNSSYCGTITSHTDSAQVSISHGGLIGALYWCTAAVSNCYCITDIEVVDTGFAISGGAIGRVNNIDGDSLEIVNVYSVAQIDVKDGYVSDSHCCLLGNTGAVGDKYSYIGDVGNISTTRTKITNCGYFAHGRFYAYKNCDREGQFVLLTEEYSVRNNIETIFKECVPFDCDVWSISENHYPVLKGQKSVKIPDSFPHNYENGLCSFCNAVDTTLVAEGTWGDNITWSIKNGVLTLSGSGAVMERDNEHDYPWIGYGFQKAVIEDEITYLPFLMFMGCTGLEEVILSANISTLSDGIFSGCTSLKRLYCKEINYISSGALRYTRLSDIYTSSSKEDWQKIWKSMYISDMNMANRIIYDADIHCNTVVENGNIIRYSETLAAPGFPTCGNDSHIWSGWYLEIPPCCQAYGEERRDCTNCPNYETRLVDPLEHRFGEWKQTAAPSNTTNGEQKRECLDCGYVETRVLHATGHTFGEWEQYETPLCIDGIKCRFCQDCEYMEVEILPATEEHTEVVDEAVPATCTIAGKTEGKHCSACGTVTVVPQSVPAKGHTEVTITGRAATCTEDGLTDGKKCDTCGVITVFRRIIPAKGHSYVDGICTVCGVEDPNYVAGLTGVTRIFGADRYETAFKTAEVLKQQLGVEKFNNIVVACGDNFADALGGSYLAAKKNAPILLVKSSKIDAVKSYIKANLNPGGTVYLLGGTAAIPAAMDKGLDGFTVRRLAGATRYDTNLLILEEAGVTDEDILICTGKNFADSLSAAAAGRPILLVKDSLNDSQKAFLQSHAANKKYILGGTAAVSTSVENQAKAYGTVKRIGGNTRYETSVLIAKEFFPNAKQAALAYAQNFPDGLSGGALAYAMKAPLVLTASGKEAAAAAYAKEQGITSGVIFGGNGLISDKAARTIFQMKSGDTIQIG